MTWNYKSGQSHAPTLKVKVRLPWFKDGTKLCWHFWLQQMMDNSSECRVICDTLWWLQVLADRGNQWKSTFDHSRRGRGYNSSVQRRHPYLSTISSYLVWAPMIFTSQGKSYMLASHNANHQVTWADFHVKKHERRSVLKHEIYNLQLALFFILWRLISRWTNV